MRSQVSPVARRRTREKERLAIRGVGYFEAEIGGVAVNCLELASLVAAFRGKVPSLAACLQPPQLQRVHFYIELT